MFKLITNAEVYSPEYLGIKDVLVAEGKILLIDDNLKNLDIPELEVFDLEGRILASGLIDQHVHIIGGGGEGGFASRTPEINVSEVVKHGVTSVVGLLGTDSDCRHPSSLHAKAMALTEEGISVWMLTGAYNIPSPTITGSVRNDVMFVERCIGVKAAIADHRAPHITYEELVRLASDCRIAGMLSGKSGIVTLHCGNADSKLDLLFEIAEKSALPLTQFMPTHINKTKALFAQALEWAKLGGYIDITTDMVNEASVKTTDAVIMAREAGIPEARIVVSTDSQGSSPVFDDKGDLIRITVGDQSGLLTVIREQVERGVDLSLALMPVTKSVADCLKFSGKGQVIVGYDADFIVLNKDMSLQETWAKGEKVFSDGKSLIKNMYEY